jgi:outer membrane protein assembly factor BamB
MAAFFSRYFQQMRALVLLLVSLALGCGVASAADPPYTIVRNNPQRSSYTAVAFNHLYSVKLPGDRHFVQLSPGGRVLCDGDKLRLYGRTGQLKWSRPSPEWSWAEAGYWDSTGRLYVSTSNGMECISPGGKLLWSNRSVNSLQVYEAPGGRLVAKDEYVTVTSVTRGGRVRWTRSARDRVADCMPFGSLSIAPDGTIFQFGERHGIFCLSAGGRRLWAAPHIETNGGPCDARGWVYVIDQGEDVDGAAAPASLAAIDTRGKLHWRRPLPPGYYYGEPQMDARGRLLVQGESWLLLFDRHGRAVYKLFHPTAGAFNAWLLDTGVTVLMTSEPEGGGQRHMLRAIAPSGRVIKEKRMDAAWSHTLDIVGDYAAVDLDDRVQVFRVACR